MPLAYLIMVIAPATDEPFYGMFQSDIFDYSTTSLVFCCPWPKVLEMCCCYQIQNKHIFRWDRFNFFFLYLFHLNWNYYILFYCCTEHSNFLGVGVVGCMYCRRQPDWSSRCGVASLQRQLYLKEKIQELSLCGYIARKLIHLHWHRYNLVE